MTFLHIFAGIEGAVILFLLWLITWLLNRLDTQRRRVQAWHDECCTWELRERERDPIYRTEPYF